jgi:IclR family pca regulon transcriptional regulator
MKPLEVQETGMRQTGLNEEVSIPGEADEGVDRRYIVPGLSRGLALLQLFTREKPEQRLTEIAMGLGLSRSAAYRLVYTLEHDEFLRRDPTTRSYRLTAKVLSLGFEFLLAQPLTDVAQPFLHQLSGLTGATAYLVIVDGWQAAHLSRDAPSATLITNLQIGARFPAHALSSGRIILAYWDESNLREFYALLKRECKTVRVPATFEELLAGLREDRARGYSFDKSLLEPAVSAVACAVRDRSGSSVAAICILAPHALFREATKRRKIIGYIRTIADAISRQLGFAE